MRGRDQEQNPRSFGSAGSMELGLEKDSAFRPGQWGDPLASGVPAPARAIRFVVVLAAHAAVLVGFAHLATRPEVRAIVDNIAVRLIEPPKPAEPPPKQEPPKPRREVRPVSPPPILAAAAEAPATASFVVPVQPPAPPSPPPAAPVAVAPASVPITEARFDADYLSNPKPVYPTASRRMGEEGKVLLRVHVGAHGHAHAVEIRQSSGFVRLDDAARAAVERWRFVPAKRGEEAVASWVLVPIVFSLQQT